MSRSSVSFLVLSYLARVAAVVDLNQQQIQYVADHLTYRKCLKLIDALNQNGFLLKEGGDETSTPSSQPLREDARRPCVIQLTNWCNGPGRDMTFDFLALRLREIGLQKVADTLSKKVLHETAEQLHRYFLDDPFKEMIPTKSLMLDKPPPTEELVPAPDLEDNQEKLFVAVTILGTICATFCTCVGVCLACPGLGRQVCRRACPEMCASCFEVALDNCGRFAKSFNQSANKHLFAAPQGRRGGPFMV
ncbi:hypothetical protein RRG08_060245 [Elysia crispata]|uniref:Death domain-containing protein n=1 Tax=Elysia crispata TaxID=231223 RepID=A0AAE0ZW70_9GAST|nr:hypothetical protein RRG08_060245 [Elysia crispata]